MFRGWEGYCTKLSWGRKSGYTLIMKQEEGVRN